MGAFDIVLIGGICVDITGGPDGELTPRSSTPGKVAISVGGVAHNVAANLAKLGLHCAFIGAVGSDAFGPIAADSLSRLGVDCSGIAALSGRTGVYMSINDSRGEMQNAVADMGILKQVDPDFIKARGALIAGAKALFADTNLEPDTLEYIAREYPHKPIFCDPVSVTKASRAAQALGAFYLIKPNLNELEALTGERDTRDGAEALLERGVKNVVISSGSDEALYISSGIHASIKPPPVRVVNVNGAGDAFMSGLIYAHFKGFGPKNALECAVAASRIALASHGAVSEDMSGRTLADEIAKIKRMGC